ncbi:MAG TPA: efflux RND transporter periplasmic adaptor subunit [Gemmatimonadaceae bacterium]|nr:efflux RND transporter periplasmic adaptor subunit [Gemmatimonadaceae bacterium]
MAIAVLAGLLAGCSQKKPDPHPRVSVAVAPVAQAAVPYDIQAHGVVEPLQTVAVESQVNGILTDVSFAEGEEVHVGQVLFRIDPRPYQAALAQARATLAKDVVQARNAARDAARYQALVKKDYVTQSQAGQAQATAAALAASVKADSAAVESARLDVDYTTIRAPISGRTGSLLVHRGNLVKAAGSTPLVVINQIRPILVRFAVPQRDFPDIQRYSAGTTLPVRATPGEDSSAAPVRGTLAFVDNAVDTVTGTVMLKARFANAGGALWPGQFVNVDLQLFVQQNALVVPSQAVMAGQDGSYVFVIDQEGTAQQHPVTVGRTVGNSVIIAKGVRAGERVVTDGQSRLAPGAKVDIRSVVAGQQESTS